FAVDPDQFFSFLIATQPNEWRKRDEREAAAKLPAPPIAFATEPNADALDGDDILDETELEEP
ncbi:MAG: hypothetical protein JWM99_4453, partial [Verrucomicrobiales bacterium]|nr:hypothetical protein [Verrucomicrobiales bacterium]